MWNAVVALALVLLATIFATLRFAAASDPQDRLFDGLLVVALVALGIALLRIAKHSRESVNEIHALEKNLRTAKWKLAVANEQIQVLDQRKNEFVSVVSHQLRAPIAAIKGYSSMVLEDSYGKLPEEFRVPIQRIFVSSKHIADLVTDFLELARIEEGTLGYYFTSVDLAPLLADLVGDFAHVAKRKGLTLTLDVPEHDTCTVSADESKVRQILSNLIDNALKYTAEGSVKVTLARDNEKGVVRVFIKDSGIGLAQDDIQHLFGKFSRGPSGQKQFTEGSGLGLYVAKKMLEQHKGGKIWADSEGPGKGTTFVLELLAEDKIDEKALTAK